MKPQQIPLLMAGVLLLASCGIGHPIYPGPGALETGHWAKVRSNPPTYFPKGLPGNHPTNYRDGFWIAPGDPADSRFFVPVRGHGGLTRDELIAEARAVTPLDKQREIARKEEWRDFAGSLAGGLAP